MTFYDSTGRAVAYTDDRETIYLFSGEPVAYLFEGMVYTFKGSRIGFYSNGWIRDNTGKCVFYTEHAIGGPIRPIRQIKPLKGIKGIKPIRSIRHTSLVRPMEQNVWSGLSGERFFIL